MSIEKTAVNKLQSRRELRFFKSARAALREVLHQLYVQEAYTLLLPGYIGYSPREGSGIYDPVVAEKVPHLFYPMDRSLGIDVEAFRGLLQATPGRKVVLLVHYFGYPDARMEEVVALCREFGAVIIEDAAHALFTDFVDRRCGNYGDFTIYSLHKMLPFSEGGMLKINTPMFPVPSGEYGETPLFDYDFYEIAAKRKANAKRWAELLQNCGEEVGILRPYTENVTPQTFPIVVHHFDRNELYFRLNEAGYGAVSLYHTMIPPVLEQNLTDAIWLSQHIINMPVHQDVDAAEIDNMCSKLLEIIRTTR